MIEVSERVQLAVYGAYRQSPLPPAGAEHVGRALTLRITAGGWLRRRAVVYRATRDNATAQRGDGALQRYPQIGQTLTQLDFRSTN